MTCIDSSISDPRLSGWRCPRSPSNNSFLETKHATQYPAYSNLDFVVELLTSLHSPNYAYRLEYCLSDRLLGESLQRNADLLRLDLTHGGLGVVRTLYCVRGLAISEAAMVPYWNGLRGRNACFGDFNNTMPAHFRSWDLAEITAYTYPSVAPTYTTPSTTLGFPHISWPIAKLKTSCPVFPSTAYRLVSRETK